MKEQKRTVRMKFCLAENGQPSEATGWKFKCKCGKLFASITAFDSHEKIAAHRDMFASRMFASRISMDLATDWKLTTQNLLRGIPKRFEVFGTQNQPVFTPPPNLPPPPNLLPPTHGQRRAPSSSHSPTASAGADFKYGVAPAPSKVSA